MTHASERAALKTAELIEIAASALPGLSPSARAAAAGELIAAFATVTAPEEPPMLVHMITMRSGGSGGATSTKPGNIFLDLRKLVVTSAGGALTFAGAGESVWMAVLAALVVWDTIWSGVKVSLTEREAVVVFTCG
ncbi:MAG TPA: hypothetical protein VNJ70_20540 [Thermoanaerobaculia bacterium]|nr:hypothetical protein [Thermoanaerobaculia bacterium]